MRTLHLAMTMAAATTLLVGTYSFAQEKLGEAKPVEKTVAFHTTADKRHVTMAPNGGLNTRDSKITGCQIFVLVDLKGGGIADGDAVQIKYAATWSKPTYENRLECPIRLWRGSLLDTSNNRRTFRF